MGNYRPALNAGEESSEMAPGVQDLTRGLHAGDLETILLTMMIAADENRLPCEPEALDRIFMFLTRLAEYDTVLPPR